VKYNYHHAAASKCREKGEAGENSRREVARDYEDLSGCAIETLPAGGRDGFMFSLDRERSERALNTTLWVGTQNPVA